MRNIVDIDILIKSKNDNRKTMEPIRTTSGPPTTIRNRTQFNQSREMLGLISYFRLIEIQTSLRRKKLHEISMLKCSWKQV